MERFELKPVGRGSLLHAVFPPSSAASSPGEKEPTQPTLGLSPEEGHFFLSQTQPCPCSARVCVRWPLANPRLHLPPTGRALGLPDAPQGCDPASAAGEGPAGPGGVSARPPRRSSAASSLSEGSTGPSRAVWRDCSVSSSATLMPGAGDRRADISSWWKAAGATCLAKLLLRFTLPKTLMRRQKDKLRPRRRHFQIKYLTMVST